MTSQYLNPFPQHLDSDGNPNAFYTVYFGKPNKDPIANPKEPFSDRSLLIALPPTQVLNSTGAYAQDIFLDGAYSIRIETALGSLWRETPSFEGLISNKFIDNFLVSSMIADVSITTGDFVQTVGYTLEGDGGDNQYLARATTGGPYDGGSLIASTGNPAIEFVGLFPGGQIFAKQFGVLFDGATDDATQMQAAINYVEGFGGTLIAGVGISLIGTGLTVQEEGVIIRGMGRDVTGNTTGTVFRATAAITLFTFSTESRRARLQDLVLDGNGVGLVGVDIDFPKVVIDNCTVRGFVTAGLRISSFSTWVMHSDIFQNPGIGILYDSLSCNDSHILLSAVSGNDQHGIRIESSPDGFFFDHVNMENNGADSDGVTNFHHVSIQGTVNNVNCTNMYHENSLNQTGFEDMRFYNIEAGMEGFHLEGAKLSASVGDELDFFMAFAGNTRNCTVEDIDYEGYNTAFIDNQTGGSGSLRTENIRNLAINGFQVDLVDYAGAPTTAGQGLNSQTDRMYTTMFKGTNQVVTNAAAQVWQLDTGALDGAAMVSAPDDGIKIKNEGIYEFDLNQTYSTYAIGEVVTVEIRVAGSIVYTKSFDLSAAASAPITLSFSDQLKAESGDVITVRMSTVTNPATIVGGSTGSRLSIKWVGIDTN